MIEQKPITVEEIAEWIAYSVIDMLPSQLDDAVEDEDESWVKAILNTLKSGEGFKDGSEFVMIMLTEEIGSYFEQHKAELVQQFWKNVSEKTKQNPTVIADLV